VATRTTAYLDASALVKLVLREPETGALRRHVAGAERRSSSAIAIVEVTRAAKVGDPHPATQAEVRRILGETDLVFPDRVLLEHAAELTSGRTRSLDAIHLATALLVEPDEFVAYDGRLLEAAAAAGLRVSSPGA
jgi:predicted nucleic acid-binding protein